MCKHFRVWNREDYWCDLNPEDPEVFYKTDFGKDCEYFEKGNEKELEEMFKRAEARSYYFS